MPPTAATDPLAFLPVRGEMARLIRQTDWSQTPVGPPDTWPQSLRTTLSIILRSRFPMFLFWGPDLICFYNDAYRPSLGSPGKHPDALGKPGETAWADIWPTIKPMIDQVLAGGEAIWHEDQLIPIYRNGQVEDVYWTFSYSPVDDDSGHIAGVLVTCMETTATVLHEQQLHEQDRVRQATEQHLRTLIAQAPFAICVLRGADFVIEEANEHQLQTWGRPARQVINKPLFTAIPEAAGQGFEALLTGVLTNGQSVSFEEVPATLPTPDGSVRHGYFNCVYQPLRESNADGSPGEINRVMSVTNEVTEQVLARRQVQENTNRMQRLFEQAPVAIGILRGPAFVVELANPLVCEVWNRRSDELLGRPIFEVLTEAAGQGFEELLTGVLETGVPFEGRELPATFLRNGEPQTVFVNFVYEPLRDAGTDRVSGIIVVGVEVTESVRARQQVEASRQQFKQLTDLVPQILWTARPDGYIDYYNKTWYDYTGFAEGYGDPSWLPILHPDDAQLCLDTWYRSVQTGEPYQIEYRFADRRKPGTYRWFIGRALPIREKTTDGSPGPIIQWFGTCTDIHDQKLAAEGLEKVVTERTESLRQANSDLERSNLDLMQFASVASHDLKEPLRKVQTFGSRLEEMLAGRLSAEETDLFGRMIASTNRMQTLVSDVLRLSKLADQTTSFEPVDLNAVIDQIRDDLDLTIQEQGADLHSANLPVVLAAPGQMHQLLLNLISNALKFQDGGKPRIRIEVVPLTGEVAEVLGLPTLNYTVVSVSDNGIGFDPKYRDKIFGMFQRLHGRSQYAGTGIGLTIVKKIVENHRGYIDVQSELGVGTTFRVALPVK